LFITWLAGQEACRPDDLAEQPTDSTATSWTVSGSCGWPKA